MSTLRKTRQVLQLVGALTLTLALARPLAADEDRVALAKQIYGELVSQQPRDVEARYQWSRRWLDAQRQASPAAKDVASALAAHLERMRTLETEIRKYVEIGILPAYVGAEARYFRAEAEAWVAAAAGKKAAPASKPKP